MARGLGPDAALFVTKQGPARRSKGEKGNNRKGNDRKGEYWKSQVICHEYGVKGHISAKCRSKHKWAWYEKSKSDADLASTASTSTSEFESESFLFSIIHLDSMPDSAITVNVASANRAADYLILDTGATNHVTANRLLFETIDPMAKGDHQVMTANNCFGNAECSGTIMFYLDRPNETLTKILLQHFLYVPACGTNNLLSIIQLMRKGVNFDFNLDRATASL
jgi:hypothetical protein